MMSLLGFPALANRLLKRFPQAVLYNVTMAGIYIALRKNASLKDLTPLCSCDPFMLVPASKSQEVGLGLGAQAGQKRLTEVLNSAGFSQVRRAATTPTNLVLEAKI